MLEIIELLNEVRLMKILEVNITCSYCFIDGRILEILGWVWREFFKLEMKKRMMEISFRKMGIEKESKEVDI